MTFQINVILIYIINNQYNQRILHYNQIILHYNQRISSVTFTGTGFQLSNLLFYLILLKNSPSKNKNYANQTLTLEIQIFKIQNHQPI